jgi:serine/threonine-protein kinase
MTLAVGTRIGSYEITAPLGEGGMGVVFRAHDTKLGRDAAVKVVSDLFRNDSERLARFRREAQVLASLNHQNIAQIYGLEESLDTSCIVMELVDGETLARKIERGPLGLDEVLPIARQICDALEAAHDKGIVHRDLKPGNVMVLRGGQVKVLDFGLAKMFDARGGETNFSTSPTFASRSGGGALVGTAAYMSPEQARGRDVDRATDTWALGCVLYEMLSGRQAFGGETMTDILGSIVKGEPDWSALPKDTPDGLIRLIRRCLHKKPAERLHSAHDLRILLDDLPFESVDGVPARRRHPALVAALVLASALIGAGLTFWLDGNRTRVMTDSSVVRLTVSLPADDRLADIPPVALSPDGAALAYVSKGQLYSRAMNSLEAKPIGGTDAAEAPFFSPDGQWIGFFAQGKLKKVSVKGGAAQALAEAPFGVGGSWASDDTIYYAPFSISGVWKVSAAGGMAQPVTTLDRDKGEVSHRWPQILPGGQAVLFTVWTGPGWDEARLELKILATGERRVLIRGAGTGRYVPSGHLVYSRAGVLMAVPFDLSRLEVGLSPPVALTEQVRDTVEGAAYTVSDAGVIAYVPGGPHASENRLVWVDRSGHVEPTAAPLRNYLDVALSPDGRHAAVTILGATWDVWLYDFSRSTLTPLTSGGSSQWPEWTPDGQRVVYRGTRAGFRNLFWKNADGSRDEERLTTGESIQTPTSLSPDGKWLIFDEQDPTTGQDVWVLPLDGDRKPQKLLSSPFNEQSARLSPNGRWLAYMSNESGRDEVYVRPFPGPGAKSQVSTEGGERIVWSRDGRELFYLQADKTMAVSVTTEPTFSAESPRLLNADRYLGNTYGAYDVSPDGRRFLRIQSTESEQAGTQINVVINWFEELKQRIPTGNR